MTSCHVGSLTAPMWAQWIEGEECDWVFDWAVSQSVGAGVLEGSGRAHPRTLGGAYGNNTGCTQLLQLCYRCVCMCVCAFMF